MIRMRPRRWWYVRGILRMRSATSAARRSLSPIVAPKRDRPVDRWLPRSRACSTTRTVVSTTGHTWVASLRRVAVCEDLCVQCVQLIFEILHAMLYNEKADDNCYR